MAFPKKGLRKITVNGIKYVYKITGNDDGIDFSIGLLEKSGEILTGGLPYNEHIITNFDKNGKITSWSTYPRTQITPNIIRQLIEYGLKNGWKPQENKGLARLYNLDRKIELNLREETKFPDLQPNQVALNFVKIKTKERLNLNMELYLGEGPIYHTFDSITEASKFAKKKINENSEIECWIMTGKNKTVKYINSFEEKEF